VPEVHDKAIEAEFADGKESLRLDGIRVLVLFGGSDLFGQERANLEVFGSLCELGLKARFITRSTWGAITIQPELRARGFEWTSAPFGYHWGRFLVGREFYILFVNLWGVLATSWRTWREARRWRATHIYAANWLHWIYAAPGIRLAGKPLIFRAGDQLPANTTFHRWAGRRLLRKVARVVCNSRFLAGKFINLGLSEDRLRIIYNCPPHRAASSHETLPKTSPDAVVVVFIGQISHHKGAPLFVEAAKKISARHNNVFFWLVGKSTWGNPLAEHLQRDVAKAGFDNQIQFLGYRKDVSEILRVAHVHVCPSISEDPSPNVMMEAKNEGLPSVVLSVGGIPELVEHGIDGYICNDKTVKALVEGIEYFLADASVRHAAGQAARRSLQEKFGRERFRCEWTEVFVATAPRPAS
jgi:glycosyltransferase involved in cell wall biosynthesis